MNTELTNNAADSYAMLNTSHFSRQNFIKKKVELNRKKVQDAPYYAWDDKNMLLSLYDKLEQAVKTLNDYERYINDDAFVQQRIQLLIRRY